MADNKTLKKLLREFLKIAKNQLCKEVTVKTLEGQIVIKDERILEEVVNHFIRLLFREIRRNNKRPINDGCNEEENSSL